jgi:hypothetical protein
LSADEFYYIKNLPGYVCLNPGPEAGFKPGTIYGSTDDFGFRVAENPYRFSGRDMRLTDVEGKLVKPLLT